MNLKSVLFVFLQYCLPQRLLTYFLGCLAECRIPWIKNSLIGWFIKKYQVDLSLAEKTHIDDYIHFNDFFTRRLKSDSRPFSNEPNLIISPADGSISASGDIVNNQLFQAKNYYYSLEALVSNASNSIPFENGKFITIYLSPRDYHRIHMPLSGKLLKTLYIPGKLFSVNAASAEKIPNLFTRNERLVCLFDTEFGKMAVIMVGAMIVAGISTVWAGKMKPLPIHSIQTTEFNTIQLIRGDEMGAFYLGSTVILLFESKTALKWHSPPLLHRPIKMGETLGSF